MQASAGMGGVTAEKLGRLAQILLVVGFVLEVLSALDSFAGLSSLARFLGGESASSSYSFLPGPQRLFIYVASALAVGGWIALLFNTRRAASGRVGFTPLEAVKALVLLPIQPREGLVLLEEACRPLEPVEGTQRSPLCTALWVSALATVWCNALFLVFLVLRTPGLSSGALRAEMLLALSNATSFFLACLWIEGADKRLQETPASPPQQVARPIAAIQAQASPAAGAFAARPVQAAPAAQPIALTILADPAPSPTAASPAQPSACVVCGAPLDSRRCPQCGSAAVAGRYRVERVLGQGSFARTYLASDGAEQVVLKEIAFSLAPDVQTIAAFEREAELLRQLRHPRIPRFVASFKEGEGASTRLYLAQQLVVGRSLDKELESHRYTEAEIVDLLRQALVVLVYLHGLSPRVIHRDIKPANLMRRRDGSLVLVDFGAARELRGTVSSGTTVGTFGYMPPEQLAGQVDETSDLYALGATAIHLLGRQPPWELLRDGIEIQLPRSLNVSRPVAKVLRKLVAARHADRFASARQALLALERAARAGTTPRWPWIAAAVVGAAALALFGARARHDRQAPGGEPPQDAPARAADTAAAAPSAAEEQAPVAPTEDGPIVARYRGGVVTLPELTRAVFGLPAPFRPHRDAVRGELELVVARKLLLAEADGELPAGDGLPDPARQRARLRSQVEAKAAQRTSSRDEAELSAARLAVLSEMKRAALDSAGLEIDEQVLSTFPASAPEGMTLGGDELPLAELAPSQRSPAPGSHRFRVNDPTMEVCQVQLDPEHASFGGHCGCEWLPTAVLDVEQLYFELFLSGDGPSILRRYNYESLPCNTILVSSMAPAYLEERLADESKTLDYRFALEVESLSAPPPIDTARLAKALLPMRLRLANCLARRQGAVEAKVRASWKLSPFGSVDGLELTVTEGPDRSVRGCLTPLLEEWRFGEASGHQPGSVEARLRLSLSYPGGR